MKYGNPKYIEQFEAAIKSHRWDKPNEKDMMEMFAGDRKDLRKVLSLYRQGKWKEAYTYAAHMDTAAREHIPNGIWNEIVEA